MIKKIKNYVASEFDFFLVHYELFFFKMKVRESNVKKNEKMQEQNITYHGPTMFRIGKHAVSIFQGFFFWSLVISICLPTIVNIWIVLWHIEYTKLKRK